MFRTVFICTLVLLGFSSSVIAKEHESVTENWLHAQHEQFASAAAGSVLSGKQQRLLQTFSIDYTPDASPEMVCTEFQAGLIRVTNGTYQCSCGSKPDKSVGVSCLETTQTCNQGSSICYQQTVVVELTAPDNQITALETCTDYVTDLGNFSGSTTQFANYSAITPCVKVVPIAPDDFSSLASCSATMNGQACHKCELCDSVAPHQGISLDCCNTQPNGEQLKVECGRVGGGGAFAPFFDTYEEGEMPTCSGAVEVLGGKVALGGFLAVASIAVSSSLF